MVLKAYKKKSCFQQSIVESFKKNLRWSRFLKGKRVSFVCLNIILMYTAHALQNIQFGSSVSQWIHDRRYEINK